MSILTAEFAVVRGGTEYKTTGLEISEAVIDEGALKIGDILLVQRGTTKYKWQITGQDYAIDLSDLDDTDILLCVDGGVSKKVTGAQFKAIIPSFYFARGVYHLTNVTGSLQIGAHDAIYTDKNGTTTTSPLTSANSNYYVIGDSIAANPNFNLPFQSDLNARFQLGSETRTSSVENFADMFKSYQGTSWNVSILDTRNATDFNRMFAFCEQWDGLGISNFYTSDVTDFSLMFSLCNLNSDISGWDVSSALNMESMFEQADFNGGTIGNWDVSSVTTMTKMFYMTTNFNQDLNNWDVSSVTIMSFMFGDSTSSGQQTTFNGNIDGWDVSSVANFRYMFSYNPTFNGSLNNWNFGSTPISSNMRNMFEYSVFNQPLNNWDVSAVTETTAMFYAASAFNQDLSAWQLDSVITAISMFYGVGAFNTSITNWSLPVCTNITRMFASSSSMTTMSLNGWSLPVCTDFRDVFRDNSTFNGTMNNWDLGSNATSTVNCEGMFDACATFNQNINSWDVSNVGSMDGMFEDAFAFNSPLSSWDTSSVTDMDSMFQDATAFNQNISGWCVSNITSKPTRFDRDAGFENNNSIQPQWGTCP